MKRDWIKLDTGILRDPTYGTLTDDLWRLMMQLNMLAGMVDKDGLLPDARDIAWELRMGSGTLLVSLHHLAGRGLLHPTPQGWVVTGFKESQAAPSSTERSREFRKRRRSASQEETENNSTEQSPARCTGQAPARCTGQAPARCTEQDSILSAKQTTTFGATQSAADLAVEMQLSRHIPVSKPVPAPDPDPGQPRQPGKRRHRRKAKGQPVEPDPVDTGLVEKTVGTCPVDGFPQGKGWNFSDPDLSSSTSSLIKSLKTSLKNNLTTNTSSVFNSLKTNLNIKLPLPELDEQPELEIESEKFRPAQENSLENRGAGQDHAPLGSARQPGTEQARVVPDNFQEPAGMHPVEPQTVDTCPVDTCPVDKSVENPVDKPVDRCPQEKGRKNSDPEEQPP